MCKNIFTNENEFDLNDPITVDGVHTTGYNPDPRIFPYLEI